METKHNIDKFQGYPHYPASEDITRAGNNNGRVNANDGAQRQQHSNDTVDDRDKETNMVSGTEADVTDEDIKTLNAAEQNMDTTDGRNLVYSALDETDDDGEPLNEAGSLATDMTGESLDVPGSELDDNNEFIGEEDEENNYYSLGGDLHENQEENKGE